MFSYSQDDLYCEQVPLADLAAGTGTPAYVYSSQSILANYRAYDEAFGDLPHSVCYAVKANSSLAVLRLLAEAGAGFDIVSGGELFRVFHAGGDPSRVVFSGVGKTPPRWNTPSRSGIHGFNCESESELALIDALAARRGVKAGFSIRVNPDVDAATHPYISTGLSQHKFGIAIPRRPRYTSARAHTESFGRGRELPHRLADSRSRPRSWKRWTRCWSCRRLRAAGTRFATWTWAAAWAWRTAPARRRRRSAAFVESLHARLREAA